MIFVSTILLALAGGQNEPPKVDQALQKKQSIKSTNNVNLGIRGKLKPVTKEEFDRAAPQKVEGSLKPISVVSKNRRQ